MKAGKVWGQTELVEANGALEFHRIEMKAGGVCSKHLHRYKWNGFYVESGQMLVKTWQRDYNLVDETLLKAGDYHKVKPGLYHQFECIEDGVAFELYWAEFNHNDIVRESVGYNHKRFEEQAKVWNSRAKPEPEDDFGNSQPSLNDITGASLIAEADDGDS